MEFFVEPREPAPPLLMGEVVVKPPPDVPRETTSNPLARLLPVVMIVATAGMMIVYFASGGATTRSPVFLFFPVMMLVSLLGTVATGGRGGSRTAEINQCRREYLRYLADLDVRITKTAEQQRASLSWSGPDPGALWEMVGSRRMWERTRAEADFGCVRIGLGPQSLSTPLVAPDTGTPESADPVTSTQMRRLMEHRSMVADLPVSIALTQHASITMDGDAAARGLLRALVCQLVVTHSPRDLRIAAAVDPIVAREWDWLKWLPHHQHPSAVDDCGPARLTYNTVPAAVSELVDCGDAHAVLLVDGDVIGAWPRDTEGVTVIALGATSGQAADLCLVVSEDQVVIRSHDGDKPLGRPDAMTTGQALAVARRVSCYRLASADGTHPAQSIAWADLMDVDDIGVLDRMKLRASRRSHERALSVPIGIAEDGTRVELDIKEAAKGGMGPHGLCIGATGSGKSEFLRTLTLGMIAAHPSEALNLVLVDFKGGATFLGFERVPHVAAVITNLADEAHLVSRMRDALAGEVNRRQELLRAAGNFANIADYNAALTTSTDPRQLPALFVVVDEFSELLSQHPDFIDMFIAIGRLGRSLGIHLLLASQRADEGRLRGLESHLSYRVCLKTFSAAESRSVLGIPDAYHLPSTPGAAFLKAGAGDPIRFHTAFVSGPYVERPKRATEPSSASTPRVFTAAPTGRVMTEIGKASPQSGSSTVLDAVIAHVDGSGSPAHQVWLPPMTVSPRLESLLHHVGPCAPLTVPIGLVDRPFEQRREVLTADLTGGTGNIAVVGGPRSGKSTTLQTVVLGLAETCDPRDVQFYCLDFGGGVLSSLAALPHVGSVAGRRDVDLIRRTVVQVESLLRAREARGSRRKSPADDPYGEVFLVVDGWAAVRQEFDALEVSISALAVQGLSYGIHVAVSASRWAEIRPALKDQIGTRIELRLGDPAESEMDRKRARQLAQSPPGRGVTRDGHEFVIAESRFDAPTADRLQARYADRTAPRVEVLPMRVDYDALIARAQFDRPGTDVLIGLGEAELAPIAVDFAAQAHLVIFGDGECGKTAAVRALCREIIRTNTAHDAQLIVVDFRRTLLGVVESDHLAAYVPSASALTPALAVLIERLRARTPGADVSQQELRTRSWWSGPELYVVVDDYDLVAPPGGANPLTPLLDFLPYAKDLGLHMVVARRSGGAARAMFDPVLARLRELGCMGLVMSGSPDEGVLVGDVRPSQMPPGRGILVTRAQPDQLVQLAWTEPT